MGKFVPSFPGVLHGPIYYRNLEKDKSTALANNKGNFDAHMKLSTQAIAELTWWSLNILDAYNPFPTGRLPWYSQSMHLKKVGGRMRRRQYPGIMV